MPLGRKKLNRFMSLILAVALTFTIWSLTGCSKDKDSNNSNKSNTTNSDNYSDSKDSQKKTTVNTNKKGTYSAPDIKMSDYNSESAESVTGGNVDLRHLSDGYVVASVKSDSRLKFQIMNGQMTYNYDLPIDGKETVYPINMGNGSYVFRIMKNVVDDKYTELWKSSQTVYLTDEFQPYLRPNQFVDYNPTSNCVAKAKELASHCDTDLEVASAVYDYIVNTVKYDYDEAKTVQSGYLPYPDEVLSTKKGICFDYASLAAAMLRSQGIPTQLITGYMGAKSQYHAWNKIYIKGKGWIVGEIKVSGDNWKRVDMTLAASGEDVGFLEDDGNYTTRYVY